MSDLNQFMIDESVVGVFDEPITLKSGRLSNWYVNWRHISNDPFLLEKVSHFLIDFVGQKNISFDTFYGVPEGATKLGVITQFLWAKSQGFQKGDTVLSMGRSKEKTHGAPSDRYFIGEPKGQVIVLEDVVTTGGSLIDCLKKLKQHGVDVVASIALTQRGSDQDTKTFLSQMDALNIPFYSLADGEAVIRSMIQTNQIQPTESLLTELKI